MTVSRVMNGGGLVHPVTRRLVQAAVEELNYSPNPVARALAGSEHLIVALLHRFPSPGHLGAFLTGLLEEGRLYTSFVLQHVTESARAADVVDEVLAAGAQAVLLAPPVADIPQLLDRLRAEGLAVVGMGATKVHREMAWVGIDDRRAARAIAEHLLSLGHRRIGFIKGHPGHASTSLRFAGFCEALNAADVEVAPTLIAEGSYTYRSGLEAAEMLLTRPTRPTAIFASNDDMAAATVAVAHRRGIDVPDELSVCGFDDTPLATTIWPELTTIRQPTRDLARVAVELLRGEASRKGGEQGRTGTPHILLDYTLVRRQSDDVPPGAGDGPAALGAL